jgi:hypothetical protein
VTFLEAQLMELGSGNPKSRRLCKAFVDYVIVAAGQIPTAQAPSPDLADLHWAIEHGTDEEFGRALQVHLEGLPCPSGFSDAHLARAIAGLRNLQN